MSIRFQADADLNQNIVLATRRREPGVDFLSAADAGLEGIADSEVLDRAALESRVLISHDRRTMPLWFRARLETGQSSPGLLIASQQATLGPVVEAIILIWSASAPGDWRDQIYYLPSLGPACFVR